MGGLFIDIYIEYFIRLIVRLIRDHKSRNWPAVEATISSTDSERLGYACPCAQLNYIYQVSAESYSGSHVRGFILRSSAEDFAGEFLNRGKAVVRIKPGDPEHSVLRYDDQAQVLVPESAPVEAAEK